jgi:hypothetical protein
MNIIERDKAVSALRVAPLQTVGLIVSTIVTPFLALLESEWAGVSLLLAAIFGALLYQVSPAITDAAKARDKARHRYPY